MTLNIFVIETQKAHSGDTLLLDCVRHVHVYRQHQQQMNWVVCEWISVCSLA